MKVPPSELYCLSPIARFGSSEEALNLVDFRALSAQLRQINGVSDFVLTEEVSNFKEASQLFQQLLRDKIKGIYLPRALIEMSHDPRLILGTIRRWLFTDPAHRMRCQKKPGGLRGLWRWSEVEYLSFLKTSGFELVSESAEDLIFRADEANFKAFLESHGLPPPSVTKVLFTHEHSRCLRSGGIGTYAAKMEMLHPSDEMALAYVGPLDLLPLSNKDSSGWFIPTRFCDARTSEQLPLPDRVAQLLQILIFLYPNLKNAEFPDHRAVGLRAIELKDTQLLPEDLCLEVRCHGTHLYLEEGSRQWLRLEDMETLYQEKVALERADVVSFPTSYLQNLYRDMGYEIAEERARIVPYRFGLAKESQHPRLVPIDTLIFYGKRSVMKGFPAFVEALERLRDDSEIQAIRKILVIGPKVPGLAAFDARLLRLASRFEIQEELHLNQQQILRLLCDRAPHSLVVLPYEGDNLPQAIFDTVSSGCQVLAARAGGIPEFFSKALQAESLHLPGVAGLVTSLRRTLSMNLERRQRLRDDVWIHALEAEKSTAALRSSISPRKRVYEPRKRSTISLIVPCFNTPENFIRELIEGLNQQSYPSEMTYFVDDGSEPGYGDQLESWLRRELLTPYTILRHPENLGLAAARNTALAHVNTDYVVNLDSDDIPLRHFIKTYVECLDYNPELNAVSSYNDSFIDGHDWRHRSSVRNCYRPFGEGIVLGQITNPFGHANSAFRVAALRELQGWDQSSRAMWEDWALFLKMRGAGQKIGIVPESHFLYRERADSMSRTYDHFSAHRRVANLPSMNLPRFEVLRLRQLGVLILRYDSERNLWPFRRLRQLIEKVLAYPRLTRFLKKCFARIVTVKALLRS